MEININSLKQELSALNKLIEEYNINNLNMYNTFSSTTPYWIDPHSILFQNNINFEKIKVTKTYNEMIELKDIYNYMITSYQNIGDKIKINISGRENILNKFDNIISMINSIINKYNNLDYSFANVNIITMLNKEKTELNQTKERIINLKTDIYKKFNYIENIEREIALKISRINIEYLEEIKTEGMV